MHGKPLLVRRAGGGGSTISSCDAAARIFLTCAHLHLPEVLVPVDCVGGLPAHLSASCMSRATAVDILVPPSRHLPECMGSTALFLLVPTRIIEGLQTTFVMFSSGVWGRTVSPSTFHGTDLRVNARHSSCFPHSTRHESCRLVRSVLLDKCRSKSSGCLNTPRETNRASALWFTHFESSWPLITDSRFIKSATLSSLT